MKNLLSVIFFVAWFIQDASSQSTRLRITEEEHYFQFQGITEDDIIEVNWFPKESTNRAANRMNKKPNVPEKQAALVHDISGSFSVLYHDEIGEPKIAIHSDK